MKYRARHLAVTVRRAIRTFPAVLVTGPRQSGKTTMLREELGARYRFVSLERPDVRTRAASDPVGFLVDHPPPVILDEIQYAPALLSYVKEAIDARRRPGQWLLTGSQSVQLMRGIGQTLAGRVAVLSLDPLSIAEATSAPPRRLDALLGRVFSPSPARPARPGVELAQWLLRGGYPEPHLDRRVDRQLWYASYIQTYLERDVRDLVQVGDLDAFTRFLQLVAARSGALLNMSELGADLGIAGPTVRRWLSVLEASQIVYLLRPYHRNLGKRITKSPKLYLCDPGLATFLLGLHTPEAILHGPSLGALMETAVVGEWVKAFRQAGEQPALYHFRASTGLEVDLIIERNQRLYGIEIKATATPTPRHADALARWLDLAGPAARGAVACRIAEPAALRPRIRAVPWHLAW